MSQPTSEDTATAPVDGRRNVVFADYSPSNSVYDEMVAGPDQPRPHWLPLLHAMGRLGREELQSRTDTAQRFLRENGVTYNVYGDSQGFERTWKLDPFPLLVSPQEWRQIEAGLIQRTHLLSLILADLYDGQRLLHEY